MNLEDRLYSASELSGGKDIDERLYSADEVEFMADLFSEYYQSHADYYNDNIDSAYSDFYDAYSAAPIMKEQIVKAKERKVAGDPKPVRAVATLAGGALGYGAAKLLSLKDKAKAKKLAEKISAGQASRSDIRELDSLNKKIKRKAVAGAVIGGAAGLGATVLASNYARKKMKEKSFSYNKPEIKDYVKDTKSNLKKLGRVERAVAGGALGALAAQGVTSLGAEAEMRRQLKKKLKDGTLSINERAQLRDLINKRDKAKWTGAKIGGVAGFLSK